MKIDPAIFHFFISRRGEMRLLRSSARVLILVARWGQSPNILHLLQFILLEGCGSFEYETVKIEWVYCRNSNKSGTVPS